MLDGLDGLVDVAAAYLAYVTLGPALSDAAADVSQAFGCDGVGPDAQEARRFFPGPVSRPSVLIDEGAHHIAEGVTVAAEWDFRMCGSADGRRIVALLQRLQRVPCAGPPQSRKSHSRPRERARRHGAKDFCGTGRHYRVMSGQDLAALALL